jgi:hypothetical protein
LGASVIASSVAVNGVYPAAVTSAVYPNITGVGVQTQALNMNTHQITGVVAPTLGTDAATKAYVDSATGTVAGNAILNQNTLQSGATFYVSSGTVNGQLTAGTLVGSGAGITNVTAANINAGSLGASVITSSISINGVYPAAVTSAVYSNITGVGAQTQALNMNTHQINGVVAPTLGTDAATKAYVDAATATITGNSIFNQNTLQAGATFYVSSGTVNGQFSAGTIIGSGAGITNLTAANISAGALGASVIASSMAINGVYPAAVTSAVYPNITGVGVQTQALNMNTHQINGVVAPTLGTDAATKAYVDSATGTVAGNSILNQNTLQSGATFYVSSGTVSGQFSAGTMIGSGAGITNLTAANITAGSLGASVIASSIAVNGVYPAAVTSAVYPTITGVGAQTQALNMNTHQINGVVSPTLTTDAATKGYVDIATAAITNNAILNQNTLQAGATFYVSSGTVNGQFTAGTLVGSGAGITNVTAANISAGSLGASVIASSMAVNAVYPSAVTSAVYPNITGVGSQTQALNMNTHQINGVVAPTLGTDAATKAYVDAATATVTGNSIFNQNTLQAGATFYVSSGTVNGQFSAGTILGSGAGITNLTAANINAGSLGASVIASSIVVNGVYPAAVTSAVYPTITGVGAQTQALNMNTHQINGLVAPTLGTDAATKAYVDTATGTIAANSILNQNTLQSGATFYVSSGTVNGQFSAGTLIGSGAGITNLTAANINSGSLGASVIASSIAVNGVYPAAVTSAVYPNITGVGAQTQALNMNTHQINGVVSPTLTTDAATKGYVDAATATLTNSAILNQNTLQSGATFYVSSGTVNGQLSAGTFLGNGASLTNLTAANINAGSLGASVISSSMAINGVYPAALASGVYSNVTGIGSQTQAMNLGNHLINNVSTPISLNDAATKSYVDTATAAVSGSAILNQNTLQSGATFYVSSGTIVGQLSAGGNAYPIGVGLGGQFLQTNGLGALSWQTPASSGGTPALAVNRDGVQVSSPTSVIKFYGNDFNVALQGSATAFVTLNPATTDFIQNSNTLQSGSTFYVSSGTVSGQLSAGTFIGSGAGITALTAANISAGSLGASVIASSIAVNGVYPAAVTSAVYPNITGIGAQTQALNMNTHQINGVVSPTLGTDAATKAYVDSATGTVAGSAILNQNTLQSGATFYVSSGTVSGQLSVGTFIGSGAGITNLTAANISAGSLGAAVIASSIVVNGVYPAAVTSAVYPNITGVGAQTQALNMNTHQINGVVAPTLGTDAATKAYVDAATGTIASNSILNQNTLQAGSTFYVSSGTVSGQFSAGTLIGSGAGITNLTAANINAGSLGASVIASSIAINGVYPAAVTSAVYPNITGIGAQTQALNMNTHQINGVVAPTLGTDAATKAYVDTATGTVAASAILNQNTLQAGATFYVSSGTVSGQLSAGTMIGSGAGITNLTAANITAGSLGASVIASSIAINGLYPAAVTSAVYPNITGIGAQAQALNMNTHQINGVVAPTLGTDAATKAYVDAATATITGNSIFNQNTLQAGATFYVSSGTVNGQFTAGTIIGSGAGITNLTAANISAGSLGASVIASSIAINGVYPAAITSAVYPNITGVGAQTQALNLNTHQINGVVAPTLGTDAATKAYVDTATGTVAASAILNQNTLQAGSTFYVSSGTVSGQLSAGTLVGSGAGITSLTASNINAGSLGAAVIASSIAINAVYPTAVTSAVYPNITGIGAQTQALNMNTHQINGVVAPTLGTDAATKAYVDAATATITGNSIFNQNTLQAGATFYVSSGTVNGQFSAGTIIGSGAGITNLTAANISAGSLGASVIASSIAINGVYPAAVTSAVYPNIIGIGAQTQALNMNTHQINGVVAPTLGTDAATKAYVDTATGTVAASAILNQNTLQSGATFYVSSGTVTGQFTAGTHMGNGAGLTSLTAANISAGSLGASVIVSSIAINGVYPAAVTSAVYPNITGVGTQTQALNMNTHQINGVVSPTLGTDAATKAYVDAATATVTGNSIFNQNTLQAGATFYVSSGTVNGQFSAGTIIGSGAGITNLTAANISAGSLGASVITSSIVINGVYPAAVTSGVYPNITGIGAQTQALNMNTHQINGVVAPTLGTDAATKAYVDTATGTVAANAILNQNTLQAGSTFYVSSGTVSGQFSAGTLLGSGAGITNLTAANISAGSLGASVIASSIAINGVYPAAVTSAVYPNITGVGAQTQALNMNTHQINGVVAPTLGTDAATKAYVDAATATVTGNSIFNQNTLQAGATFYVSSGTVNGQFSAGTIIGSGAGITNLTAANISAGSLGASVITSSIAINTVYPAAVTSAVYPNITGVGAQTQALNMNTHQINGVVAPTLGTDAATKAYVDTATGTVAAGGILNQNTLQSGATFYVSSGTVTGQFTAGTHIGNGAGLTSLTAANISAGSLGASVIASSIAINGVYPAAVTSAVYPNITGVGAQTQALNMNTHQINGVVSPTLGTDAATKAYVDSATGTVAGSAILNQNTLQSGATFYVSSGTVSGQFSAGTILGSGASITNLTAANISAGSLGASVITSSIAINGVYPAAVTSAVYPNITGVGAQTQALNMNTHQINGVVAPTLGTDAATKAYVDTATGTVAASAILNQNTLQSGATFYVSSGTVSGQFSAGTMIGNGAGLTNLTAANISAGSLGTSVIASSIVVNGVYPAAVTSAVYPNITGVGAQTQALNMNTHQINGVVSPTLGTDAATKAYVDSATGTVAGSAILNQNTLQSGSTFYVSSGTVSGQFTAGTLVGSGAGITNIAAVNINAGSLGASVIASSVAVGSIYPSAHAAGTLPSNVIASSIAVNAVYPAGVTSGIYGNITGVGSQGQALNMNTHQINNVTGPTSASDAATKGYVDAASVASSTSAILNQNTLQSGTTFFVSSGTVNGQLTAGTEVVVSSIGIGVTTPLRPLEVASNDSVNTTLGNSTAGLLVTNLNTGGTAGTTSDILFRNDGGGTPGIGHVLAGIHAVATSANAGNTIGYLSFTTASALTEKLRISEVGTVTISSNTVLPGATFYQGSTPQLTNPGIDNLNYTWPSSHSSGVLTNNGSGTLTWAAAGGGSSILNQNTLQSGATFYVSSGTINGQTNLNGATFARGTVTISSNVYISSNTVGFDEYNNGSVSGGITVNWNNSNKQVITLSGNVTSVAFTSPPHACNLILRVNSGAGGFSVAGWPGTLKWSMGLTPTITSTASKNDILTFYFDGANYYGVDSPNF